MRDPYKGWKCDECKERKLYLVRGCNFFKETIPEEDTDRYQLGRNCASSLCPLSYGPPEFIKYMRYYNYYINGHLFPEQGGVLDQQNIFLEFIEIVDSVKNEVEKEQIDSNKK